MSSRNSNGNVPNVYCNSGKVYVNWYNPQNVNANIRTRAEVPRTGRLTPRFRFNICNPTIRHLGYFFQVFREREVRVPFYDFRFINNPHELF